MIYKLILHWASIIFIINTSKWNEKFISNYVTITSICHIEKSSETVTLKMYIIRNLKENSLVFNLLETTDFSSTMFLHKRSHRNLVHLLCEEFFNINWLKLVGNAKGLGAEKFCRRFLLRWKRNEEGKSFLSTIKMLLFSKKYSQCIRGICFS